MDCMNSVDPPVEGCFLYDSNGQECPNFRRCSTDVDDIPFGYSLWENPSLYVPYEGSRIETNCAPEKTSIVSETPICWCDPTDLQLKCSGCYEWPSNI